MGLLSVRPSDPEHTVRTYDGCVKIMDRIEKPLNVVLVVVFLLALLAAFVDDGAWTAKLLFLLFPFGIAFLFAGVRRWYVAGIRMELARCDKEVREEFARYAGD